MARKRYEAALPLLLALSSLHPAASSLTIASANDILVGKSYRVHNMLYWEYMNPANANLTMQGVRLVDLQLNKTLFNHCDLAAYSPRGVEALLLAHGACLALLYLSTLSTISYPCRLLTI